MLSYSLLALCIFKNILAISAQHVPAELLQECDLLTSRFGTLSCLPKVAYGKKRPAKERLCPFLNLTSGSPKIIWSLKGKISSCVLLFLKCWLLYKIVQVSWAYGNLYVSLHCLVYGCLI